MQMQKANTQIIFKSLSSVRSIVQPLNDSITKRLDLLKFLPTQFQKCLEGNNIRVHVIGDVLFAMKIISDSIDYRYAGREGNNTELQHFDLPDEIRQKCFNLSAALFLPFCGIDLFHTTDGEYYCFEVNPCPGYSFFQRSSSDISDAIVNFLQHGTAKTYAHASN